MIRLIVLIGAARLLAGLYGISAIGAYSLDEQLPALLLLAAAVFSLPPLRKLVGWAVGFVLPGWVFAAAAVVLVVGAVGTSDFDPLALLAGLTGAEIETPGPFGD